ncbi:hypothetical protein ILYODFUR_016556 [Ilyodon furcidens]|uniref:Uncharacterized protein n=1 Tax=Ilyodon furcidens TaxID=33524 RepID=A0ABV0T1C3_9TELE
MIQFKNTTLGQDSFRIIVTQTAVTQQVTPLHGCIISSLETRHTLPRRSSALRGSSSRSSGRVSWVPAGETLPASAAYLLYGLFFLLLEVVVGDPVNAPLLDVNIRPSDAMTSHAGHV